MRLAIIVWWIAIPMPLLLAFVTDWIWRKFK